MNKLRIAIVYEDNEVYCQLEPNDFRNILKKLLELYDFDTALEKLEEKIKQEALRV